MAAAAGDRAAAQGCESDLDRNGLVSGSDLGILVGAWGTGGGSTGADLNGDGTVSGADLGILVGDWGPCPVPEWANVLAWAPDSAVVTNPSIRAAIGATGLPWRVEDRRTRIQLVLIPPGTYQRGCSASNSPAGQCAPDELPVRSVSITRAFYLGRFEVTQAQWVAEMPYNPSWFAGLSNHPVESVAASLGDASVATFLVRTGFRLPTEAEWEYAYRAGTVTAFHGWPTNPSGTNSESQINMIGWVYSNACNGGFMACATNPVGLLRPNGFGLYDMAGNVKELVSDWYSANYYSVGGTIDPTGPGSTPEGYRVFRGGCWGADASSARASDRGFIAPGSGGWDNGFRVARDP